MKKHGGKKIKNKNTNPTFYEGKTCNLVPLPRGTSKTLLQNKG
jgi:hypothetical protein